MTGINILFTQDKKSQLLKIYIIIVTDNEVSKEIQRGKVEVIKGTNGGPVFKVGYKGKPLLVTPEEAGSAVSILISQLLAFI